MKFSYVANNVFRGGQPVTPDDYYFLRNFATIIKLNHELLETESLFCKHYGIQFRHIPLSGWFRPTINQLNDIAWEISVSPKPLFIHCTHGSDRTGLAILNYRIGKMKMPFDAAYKELMDNGHSKWMFWWNKTIEEIRTKAVWQDIADDFVNDVRGGSK